MKSWCASCLSAVGDTESLLVRAPVEHCFATWRPPDGGYYFSSLGLPWCRLPPSSSHGQDAIAHGFTVSPQDLGYVQGQYCEECAASIKPRSNPEIFSVWRRRRMNTTEVAKQHEGCNALEHGSFIINKE